MISPTVPPTYKSNDLAIPKLPADTFTFFNGGSELSLRALDLRVWTILRTVRVLVGKMSLYAFRRKAQRTSIGAIT